MPACQALSEDGVLEHDDEAKTLCGDGDSLPPSGDEEPSSNILTTWTAVCTVLGVVAGQASAQPVSGKRSIMIDAVSSVDLIFNLGISSLIILSFQ